MKLQKSSTARKISRYEVEITLHAGHKSYILLQVDLATAPPKQHGFSCVLDDWVDAIN